MDALLRHEAERTGRTISELTRDALQGYLGLANAEDAPRRPHLEAMFGIFDSGRGDLSTRVEEILREEVEEFAGS